MKLRSKKILRLTLHQLRDFFLAYLLSIIVTYFFAGNKLFTDFYSFIQSTQFGFLIAIALWKGNQLIGWIVSQKLPWRINPKLTVKVVLISSFLYSLLAIFVVYYYVFQIVFNVNFFDNLDTIIPQMIITFIISLLITGIFYLVQFFKWWRLSAINEERLKQETIQLKYDALKNQMNPHFLFNSLSILSALVDSDVVKAKQFIQQFSDIYRYVLDKKDKDVVPLEEEIKFVESYINLHLMRHGKSLKISIDINDLSGYIIPLSLQTLLENCFKHNIISEEKPLEVKLSRDNDYIIVSNSLQKKRTIHDSNGIGLETISKQYEFLSQLPVQIIQDDKAFTVKIPILKNLH